MKTYAQLTYTQRYFVVQKISELQRLTDRYPGIDRKWYGYVRAIVNLQQFVAALDRNEPSQWRDLPIPTDTFYTRPVA